LVDVSDVLRKLGWILFDAGKAILRSARPVKRNRLIRNRLDPCAVTCERQIADICRGF
jgi:hypothetical protein